MALGAEREVCLQEEPRPRWKPEPLAGNAGSLLGEVGSVPGRPHTRQLEGLWLLCLLRAGTGAVHPPDGS